MLSKIHILTSRVNLHRLRFSLIFSVKKISSIGVEDHPLYTNSHLELQEPVRRFIDEKVNPHVAEWEANCSFPARSLFKEFGKFGIFGIDKSKEYGGLGLDFSYSIAIAEVMGSIECGAVPMACAVQSDMATPALAQFGSEGLKREFLEPTIKGDRVACLGVSEQGAGSDVAGIRTMGHFSAGGDLLINGSKCWITNGHQADWICLLANTIVDEHSTEINPHRNKSLICVNMSEPGITLGRKIEKLGMRSSDTAEIFFENVRVPAANIIGRPGEGFKYQMQQFQNERLIGVALLLQPMERILCSTLDYSLQRQMFGGSAFDRNQVIQYTLAELNAELEALRSLLYRAVVVKVRDDICDSHSGSKGSEKAVILSSMAKFKGGRLARRITDECLQIWGGNGYTWENIVARGFRDYRLFSIGGGCDEVMLSIISRYLRKQSIFKQK